MSAKKEGSRRGKRGGRAVKASVEVVVVAMNDDDPKCFDDAPVLTHYCTPRDECNIVIRTLVGDPKNKDGVAVKRVVFECLRSDLKRVKSAFIDTMLVDAHSAKSRTDIHVMTVSSSSSSSSSGSSATSSVPLPPVITPLDEPESQVVSGMIEAYVPDWLFESERELLDFFEFMFTKVYMYNVRQLADVPTSVLPKDSVKLEVRIAYLLNFFGCHNLLMKFLEERCNPWTTHLTAEEQLALGMNYHHEQTTKTAATRLMYVPQSGKRLSTNQAKVVAPYWQEMYINKRLGGSK